MKPTTLIVDEPLEKKKKMMKNKENTEMGHLWKKMIKNAAAARSTISPQTTKNKCLIEQHELHDEPDSSFIPSSLSLPNYFSYISTYIPVGCIRVHKRDFPLSDEDFSSCKIWHAFYLPGDIDHFQQSILYLPNTIQGKLLRFEPLKSYQGIHNAGWIRMEFKSKDQNSGQIRVYILPNVRRSGLARLTIQLYKGMESLLKHLDISHATWQGKWSDDTPFQHIDPSLDASKSSNTVSVFEIVNSLPSPRPNPKIVRDEYIREAMQSIMKGDVRGIFSNTKLYQYQCRTAAMMLHREAQQTYLLDPRLRKIKDQAGNDFYLDRSGNVCFREPCLYESPRGGICAENMGLGKTLICLALILSTNHLSSQIPVEHSVGSIPVRNTTGSLLDIAASTIGRLGIPWESLIREIESEQGTELNQVRQALNRGRGYYWHTPDQPQGETCKPANEPRKIWLTKATLVVIPPNLIPQWVLEIEKHTTGLEYLVMDDLAAPLPAVENLLTYDIVFFSKERFNKDSKLDHSPLKQLRFKRLITDECHGFGNSKGRSTDGIISIDSLHLDARWIVLGTPTQCLYGSDAHSSVNDNFPDLSLSPNTYTIQQNLFIEQERMDLEMLGNILRSFLNARPWADATAQSDQASWKSLVIEPRYDRHVCGDTNLIKSTLKSIMIRHTTEDINEQLSLPPLHKKIVYLDGCFQNKLSLNLFSMMIFMNAVISARKGTDYLFHPKARGILQILVSNLREASFTWSGFTATMIEESLRTARKFLEKDDLDPKDKSLLEKAIQVGNLALSNNILTAVSRTHEIPMYIWNYLHRNTRCTWALDWDDGNPTLMGASQLIYAKELFNSRENNNKSWERAFNTFENVKENETDSRDPSEAEQAQSARPDNCNGGHIPAVPRLSSQKMENRLWKRSTILSTGSSKLSYLMDQVFVHHNYEKIIIFYEAENVGYHIREALICMDIQFLIYTKGDSASERSMCAVKFNTLSDFRVMLMDVHQAAFCSEMIAASRIYFVNPVLSPQIEAHAIKRAQCTGQMRPVYVETLVLRGSIEEAILKRRGIMNDQKHMDLNNVLGDPKLRDWLQNMPFYRLPDEKIPGPQQLSLLVNIHIPFTNININRDDIGSKLCKWQGKGSGRPGLTNNISQCVSSVLSARDNLDLGDLMRHLGREDQLRIFLYYRQELHKRKADEKLTKQGNGDNWMECCLIGHKSMHLGGNTSTTSDDTSGAYPMTSRKYTRGQWLSAGREKRPPLPARAVSEVMTTSMPNQLQRASSLSLRSKDTQIERQQATQRDVPTTAFGYRSAGEVGRDPGFTDGEFDQLQMVVVADDYEVSETTQARQVAEGSEGTITMAELAAIHAEYDADPNHGNLYDE